MKIREVLNVSRELAVVKRYSMAHLNRPESVLEHTGQVCIISMMIGLEIPIVDMGELMMKAACHDMEEAKIGDIASPIKYDNPQITEQLHKVGCRAMRDISKNIDSDGLYDIWSSSKNRLIEGRIVKIADVLSVLAKIHEEVVLYSNISFVQYAHNTIKFFKEALETEMNPILREVLEDAVKMNEEIINEYI